MGATLKTENSATRSVPGPSSSRDHRRRSLRFACSFPSLLTSLRSVETFFFFLQLFFLQLDKLRQPLLNLPGARYMTCRCDPRSLPVGWARLSVNHFLGNIRDVLVTNRL